MTGRLSAHLARSVMALREFAATPPLSTTVIPITYTPDTYIIRTRVTSMITLSQSAERIPLAVLPATTATRTRRDTFTDRAVATR
ncbi:MAG: hypothetical protein JWP63_1545 [Candidatus Solibacter sp.]|nr:hypothetical protein [Candidatus Solibacter sp.]